MFQSLFYYFHYEFVRNALFAGSLAAILGAIVGYFVILRNVGFAVHALAHIGFTGATGAALLGLSPLEGMLAISMLGAAMIGAVGNRLHRSDVAIGMVLSVSLGVGMLFLSLYNGFSGQATALLFGNIFGIAHEQILQTLLLSIITAVILLLCSKKLFFASVHPDLAEARGVSLTFLAIIFMIVVAVAVTLASQVVGILLVFALVIGPASIATRWYHYFWTGFFSSIAIALVTVWSGILLACITNWPPSFWITAILFCLYVATESKWGQAIILDKKRLKSRHNRQSLSVKNNSLTPLMVLFFGILCLAPSLRAEESANEDASIRKFKPWLEGSTATGDWGGLRTQLADKGIELGISLSNDVFGNTTGGIKTGAVNSQVIQLATSIDFEKLFGWQGGSFYSRWVYLSGEDPQVALVGNIFGPSSIANDCNTFRNLELWVQQKFFGDLISLRAGQLVADSEFVISDYAALFMNDTLGWPAFMYTSIPNGAPAYPMGSPGVRLKIEPLKDFSVKLAVFQNVAPQNVNTHGFTWNSGEEQGLCYLSEALYRYDVGLPGQVKVGAWFDTATFPNANGSNNSFWGNNGYYGIVDQMIYRKPTSDNSVKKLSDPGLGVFGRVAFEPEDRNLLDFYCDTGLNYTGLFPKRDQDVCGIGFGYGQLGNATATNLQSQGIPTAGGEMLVELSYQAQITPWLSFQPDLQYVIHPSGYQNIPNALLVGVRASVTF